MIRARSISLICLCLTFAFCSSVTVFGEDSPLSPVHNFVAEGRLKKNVDFWISIYSQYGTDQGLIHDSKYVDVVYEVVSPPSARLIRESKQRWRKVLLSLHRKQAEPSTWTEDERRAFVLFQNVYEGDKFLKASHRKRVRFQLGQKDRFREGLVESGRYLSFMEDIFRREGLPVELTRLPFVESSFNTRARSKVGASGVWQFMRSTGKLFLRIDDAVDERNDPIRATEAAAQLLRVNYESLGKWPLAVTAYNYGRKGMMRAVRLAGTDDIDYLMHNYAARTFGFASSNFYSELLAAIQVEKNAEAHFGAVQRQPPLQFIEARIPDYVDFRDLAQLMKFDYAELKRLNPGLSDWVFSGIRLIPKGYRLRLPYDGSLDREAATRLFFAGYSAIPDVYKLRSQHKGKQPRKRLLGLSGK
ncbi:MAG: hypothetical protein A2X94_14830 [Bdellovibrionales bacterium GWB1_55_8]|nr:MAG: hypothetical protein A2X94_14830 [Bdellovibrionales bacterium GWB1_55_8]